MKYAKLYSYEKLDGKRMEKEDQSIYWQIWVSQMPLKRERISNLNLFCKKRILIFCKYFIWGKWFIFYQYALLSIKNISKKFWNKNIFSFLKAILNLYLICSKFHHWKEKRRFSDLFSDPIFLARKSEVKCG